MDGIFPNECESLSWQTFEYLIKCREHRFSKFGARKQLKPMIDGDNESLMDLQTAAENFYEHCKRSNVELVDIFKHSDKEYFGWICRFEFLQGLVSLGFPITVREVM